MAERHKTDGDLRVRCRLKFGHFKKRAAMVVGARTERLGTLPCVVSIEARKFQTRAEMVERAHSARQKRVDFGEGGAGANGSVKPVRMESRAVTVRKR